MGQRFVACDREQPFLIPPDVREWLAARHLAWFVIDAVAGMDLAGSACCRGGAGAQAGAARQPRRGGEPGFATAREGRD